MSFGFKPVAADAAGPDDSSVFGLIADAATLMAAWRRVRHNNGSAGGDGVTIAAFERRLQIEIGQLSRRLLDGTYRPRSLRRVAMRKPDGGVRRLAVPSVADRVVQTAMAMVCGPELDARFCASSHAYRPEHGVPGAIESLARAMRAGRRHIVDIDIKSFCDSIPHLRLMQELAIWMDDERVLRLVALWLRGFSMKGRGVAQGAPVSPLLSNLYLHPLDRLLSAAGHASIRYADDIVIACRSMREAKGAMRFMRRHLRAMGLRLNNAKTSILRPGEPFVFLGQQISWPDVGGIPS